MRRVSHSVERLKLLPQELEVFDLAILALLGVALIGAIIVEPVGVEGLFDAEDRRGLPVVLDGAALILVDDNCLDNHVGPDIPLLRILCQLRQHHKAALQRYKP